jgi:hypothetical protein
VSSHARPETCSPKMGRSPLLSSPITRARHISSRPPPSAPAIARAQRNNLGLDQDWHRAHALLYSPSALAPPDASSDV